jgi:hypothetical protein
MFDESRPKQRFLSKSYSLKSLRINIEVAQKSKSRTCTILTRKSFVQKQLHFYGLGLELVP